MNEVVSTSPGLWARWFPSENLAAISAYYFAIFGLAPLVGAVLGPLAFGLGIVAFWRAVTCPTARGGHHAVFAIIAGFLETILNWSVLLTVVVLAYLGYLDLSVLWTRN